MTSRPKIINAFMPPGETGGTLSNREQIIHRIHTIVNSRELTYGAIPLAPELMPSNQVMKDAGEQAMKMIERSIPADPQPTTVQFPVDTVDNALAAARKAVEDAQEAA